MSSNIITTGLVATLASSLERRLGRRVVVHRVEYKIPLPGKKGVRTQLRYTIAIEGSHPPAFYGMTINECKSRLAMLNDLLISGVVQRATAANDPGADSRAALSAFKASDRANPADGPQEQPSVHLQRHDEPSHHNDIY